MNKFLGYSSRLVLVYLCLLTLVMVLEFQYTLDTQLPLDILPKGNRNRRRILKTGVTGTRNVVSESDASVGPETVPLNESGLGSEFMFFYPRGYDPLSTEASNVAFVEGDEPVDPSASEGPPSGREASLASPSRPPKLKVSSETNAFEELVDMLTAPKTHCLILKDRPDKAAYRCSVHRQRDCKPRPPKDKHSRRKCQSRFRGRHKYRTGYKVNPVAPKWDGETDPRANSIQDPWSEGESGAKVSLTVDADYTFLEEVKRLRYSPLITFDAKFDLAGINSLHKYEIVWKLLQVLRWLLTRQGYQLVRSSTDGDDLLEYLQEEGLQEPLHILTQWKSPA